MHTWWHVNDLDYNTTNVISRNQCTPDGLSMAWILNMPNVISRKGKIKEMHHCKSWMGTSTSAVLHEESCHSQFLSPIKIVSVKISPLCSQWTCRQLKYTELFILDNQWQRSKLAIQRVRVLAKGSLGSVI